MTREYDYLIIGAGIVGLSIGNSLLERKSKPSVVIVDKEPQVSWHASGRNSGVLHAGFYYSPDSLKAKFCRDGNEELRMLIKSEGIPLLECGKVVVACNDEELSNLEELYRRGKENGVTLEMLPEQRLGEFEPLAKTHKQFLWSPRTAASDPNAVATALSTKFMKNGGEVRLGVQVNIENGDEINLSGQPLRAKRVINAAGTSALHIAKANGVAPEYQQLPILGLYKTTTASRFPLQRHVYPVPNPSNPFLGVHFTRTVDNQIKIGPTAIPVLGREQYSIEDWFNFEDLNSSIRSLKAMLSNDFRGFMGLAVEELRKISESHLISHGSTLVPFAASINEWQKKKPGLRAQLVNTNTGTFEMDFVVRQKENFVHVLNLVSPGWTSALPFSRWLVSQYC